MHIVLQTFAVWIFSEPRVGEVPADFAFPTARQVVSRHGHCARPERCSAVEGVFVCCDRLIIASRPVIAIPHLFCVAHDHFRILKPAHGNGCIHLLLTHRGAEMVGHVHRAIAVLSTGKVSQFAGSPHARVALKSHGVVAVNAEIQKRTFPAFGVAGDGLFTAVCHGSGDHHSRAVERFAGEIGGFRGCVGHRDTGKVVAHGNGLGAGLTHAALCVGNRDCGIGHSQGAGGRIGPAGHHAGGVVRIFGGNHHSGAAELLPVLVGGFRGCRRHGNAGQGADRDCLGAGLCDAVFRVGDRHRRVRLGKGAAGGVRPAGDGLFGAVGHGGLNHHSGGVETLTDVIRGFVGCGFHGNAGHFQDRDRLGGRDRHARPLVFDRHRRGAGCHNGGAERAAVGYVLRGAVGIGGGDHQAGGVECFPHVVGGFRGCVGDCHAGGNHQIHVVLHGAGDLHHGAGRVAVQGGGYLPGSGVLRQGELGGTHAVQGGFSVRANHRRAGAGRHVDTGRLDAQGLL